VPVDVAVEAQERYWYPDDGGEVWVAGFQLVDAEGRYLGRDAPELVDAGLRVSRVAGARDHHSEALQSEDAAPGKALRLRRDRDNEYDANAIAVETASGETLGFVPRELAAELAPKLDRDEPWTAVSLREQRATPRDPRTGLTILLGGVSELHLRVLPVPRD
jgi:HIRAN domain-containing protein